MSEIEPSSANRTRTTEWREEGTAKAVGRLRRQAVAELSRWDVPDDVVECAGLVASELLSNALRHGGGAAAGLRLTLRQYGPVRVRVEVRDHTHRLPRVLGDGDESGRGMVLVAALPGCWGVDDRTDGKIVYWENTDTPDTPSAAGRAHRPDAVADPGHDLPPPVAEVPPHGVDRGGTVRSRIRSRTPATACAGHPASEERRRVHP
ncbi:ATP-binding protein [Embleya sp. NPDC020630]|uniref:ATP-binding protein n=1 Tax=Embleya sp. NPDC020630 TaxID=3363979 RepID=UPI0037A1CD31